MNTQTPCSQKVDGSVQSVDMQDWTQPLIPPPPTTQQWQRLSLAQRTLAGPPQFSDPNPLQSELLAHCPGAGGVLPPFGSAEAWHKPSLQMNGLSAGQQLFPSTGSKGSSTRSGFEGVQPSSFRQSPVLLLNDVPGGQSPSSPSSPVELITAWGIVTGGPVYTF